MLVVAVEYVVCANTVIAVVVPVVIIRCGGCEYYFVRIIKIVQHLYIHWTGAEGIVCCVYQFATVVDLDAEENGGVQGVLRVVPQLMYLRVDFVNLPVSDCILHVVQGVLIRY